MAITSASLTLNSWRSVGQAYKKILQCRADLDLPMRFPWTETDVSNFTAWLGASRLSPSSIKNHCSKLSTIHEILDLKFARPPSMSRTLTGLANSNILARQEARTKGPMTPNLMLELRRNIGSRKEWPTKLKHMLWLCFSLCWHGCLRIGELLPPSPDKFVLEQTPRIRDIQLSSKRVDNVTWRILYLDIRCSKANKDRVKVEFVEDKMNRRTCPIRAYLKSLKFLSKDPEAPLFSLSNTRLLTPDTTNNVLRCCLPSVDWSKEFIVNHSLRSGLPTLMAANGFSDSAIAIQGRWVSSSWEHYVKKNRSTKMEDRVKLAKTLAAIMNPADNDQ